MSIEPLLIVLAEDDDGHASLDASDEGHRAVNVLCVDRRGETER